MRRYSTQAAPDDPNIWSGMGGLWPTNRGTYVNSDSVEASTKTATGETAVRYAFTAKTLTGSRSYVVGAVKIWEASAAAATSTALTDRTGGMTIGTSPHMTQYGNATICAMGAAAATPTLISTGGNFSALGGGSPAAEIAVTCKGAVLLFNYYDGANTYNDGWWASDIGDHTTWTPAVGNEAANGRLLDTNGPVVSAVVVGDYVYAFKSDAIYRGLYVGRPLIWQWDLVHKGTGLIPTYKKSICVCGNAIAYAAQLAGTTSSKKVMLVDGVSEPVDISLDLGGISMGAEPFFVYDGSAGNLHILQNNGGGQKQIDYCFNFKSQAWGVSEGVYGTASLSPVAIMGDMEATYIHFSSAAASPHAWYRSAADQLTLQYPLNGPNGGTTAIAPFVTSHLYGRPDRKTTFNRLTPILRMRQPGGTGTLSVALLVNAYLERSNTSTSTTATPTESTVRQRFDFQVTECFAEFRLTFNNASIEIDDILVGQLDAGAN